MNMVKDCNTYKPKDSKEIGKTSISTLNEYAIDKTFELKMYDNNLYVETYEVNYTFDSLKTS